MPLPPIKQVELSDDQRSELKNEILEDWNRDSLDLVPRGHALARWFRLWRGSGDEISFPENEASNFHIPLILWQILNSVAKEMAVLFGEDTEIIALPRGKTDVDRSSKVSRWMTYRIRQLKLFQKYYDFSVMKRIFGTAIAYLQWKIKKRRVRKQFPVETFDLVDAVEPLTGLPIKVKQPKTIIQEKEIEVTDFEGLDFTPEDLENWLVPKVARSLEDADHFGRRILLSVPELLDMRDEGKLDKKLWDDDPEFTETLYRWARSAKSEIRAGPDPGRETRKEKAEQSGLPMIPSGREDKLVIYNWFGKFRLENRDGKKQERPEDLVVFFAADLQMILGAVRLVDMFPDGRLPFVKSDLIRDPNRFHSIGIPELLESISKEMDAIHNITTDAGMMSVGPILFYSAPAGAIMEKFKYEPFTAYPCSDPNAVKAVQMGNVNVMPYVTLMPQLLSMSERLTGITETQMGRQFTGPNAPRTYGQQAMLQAESNQRLLLDLQLERENFKQILERIWEADKRWLPKPIFYRVTEEDPGDVLTEEEMQGDYDFDITPPTMTVNKAQMVQDLLQAFALASQNPIAMQNPALLAELLKEVLTKLGQGRLAVYVPDLSQLKPPMSPDEENVRMNQGETVQVHPADNHAEHIIKHQSLFDALVNWQKVAPGVAVTLNLAPVLRNLQVHIAAHQEAQKTQGASINALGLASSSAMGMTAGGPQPNMPQSLAPFMGISGGGAANPAGPTQAPLAGLLNSGRMNLG